MNEKILIAKELVMIAKELTGGRFAIGDKVRLLREYDLAIHGLSGKKISKGSIGKVEDIDDVSCVEVKFDNYKPVPIQKNNLEMVKSAGVLSASKEQYKVVLSGSHFTNKTGELVQVYRCNGEYISIGGMTVQSNEDKIKLRFEDGKEVVFNESALQKV